ncbi:S41 family peptidase [Candidatus Woesebacteria bacterium]|nr:S41 family peptidase [Candidatus Woesebacteria bacterium]
MTEGIPKSENKSIKDKDISGGAEKGAVIIVVIVAFSIGLALGLSPAVRNVSQNVREAVTSSVDGVIGQISPGNGDNVDEDIDFSKFWTVWNTLANQYVDQDISHKDMFNGAIKGMVDAINDPVTVYLTSEETQSYEESNRGAFEGIGAELGYKDEQVIVVAPLEGSPAIQAGLLAGDQILAVDGETISDYSLYEIVQIIRGDAGTDVVLTIRREGEGDTKDITITRGQIEVSSMSYEGTDENGIAYIDVDRFTESSVSEWQSVWDSAIAEVVNDEAEALILDLRGNPGGYFSAAIYAASEFLEPGDVVVQQQDRDENTQSYTVQREGLLKEIPVVVLVNEGSASASEILAGALQKNQRATIIGENTFGKGTAQDVIDYADGSSLHITVYKWLLPDGTWINPDNPVEPDEVIELDEADFLEGNDPQLDYAYELLK